MAYFIGKHEENATKSDSIDSYLINKRGEVENYWLAQQEFDSINPKHTAIRILSEQPSLPFKVSPLLA